MKAKAIGDYNMRNNVIKLTELLAEGKLTPFMSKPSDSGKFPTIALTLERKWDAYTAWYRLETDKWFRRYYGPVQGHGIMLRKLKVTSAAKPDVLGANTSVDKYLVTVEYLPNIIPDYEGYDTPANYEKAKGFIIISDEARDTVTGKDVERFVNANLKKYIA